MLGMNATEVRITVIPISADSQVLSGSHREQLMDALNTEGGRVVLEKVDIDDIQGFAGISNAGKAVAKYLTARVDDTSIIEHRGDTPSPLISEQVGVTVTIYLLEKDKAVKGKDVAQALFPEEFMASGVPQNAAQGSRFRMSELDFFGNSALLKNTDCQELQDLLTLLRNRDDLIIRIEGHVNGNMGGRYLKKAAKTNPEHVAYENATHLSLARAESVKKHLVEQGIDPERIEVEGRGGRDKLFPNPQSEAQNAANRRIEILVLAEG